MGGVGGVGGGRQTRYFNVSFSSSRRDKNVIYTSAYIRHTPYTRVVCRTPEKNYGMLSWLFLIHSFCALLMTLFLISLIVCPTTLKFSFTSLRSYSFLQFFMQLLTIKDTYTQLKPLCATLCKCFFCLPMLQEMQEMLSLCIVEFIFRNIWPGLF